MMNDIMLTFGKHKGKTLSECPRDYVEWLSQQVTICGKKEIPQAATILLNETPDTRPLYPCNTLEDAEKLAWMAGKGNERAARTLQTERQARGKTISGEFGYVPFYGDDNDEELFYIYEGGGGGYITSRIEIQEREEEERKEVEAKIYRESHPDLEWKAQSGEHIKIWVDEQIFEYAELKDSDPLLCTISIDGVKKQRIIEPVPYNKRNWAKQHGIVSVVGPIGLTAERKAILEGKAKARV